MSTWPSFRNKPSATMVLFACRPHVCVCVCVYVRVCVIICICNSNRFVCDSVLVCHSGFSGNCLPVCRSS